MSELAPVHEEIFRKFISLGNEVIGRPSKITGNFRIATQRAGSKIVFGERVTLCGAVLSFPYGNGSIELSDDVTFQATTHAGPKNRIFIGKRTVFNRPSEVHAWEGASITIGDDCLLSNVKIRTSDMHTIYDEITGDRLNHARDVLICDKVWLAEGVVISKGSHIEIGSVIGSYALVTGYIPPRSIAVGVPAKVIRENIRWDRKLNPTLPQAALPPKEAPQKDLPPKGILQRLLCCLHLLR